MQIVEYRKNPYKHINDPTKPPFSYTTLIFLAIQSNKKEKVMLGEIYQWIRDNFKYYRVTESTWQVSKERSGCVVREQGRREAGRGPRRGHQHWFLVSNRLV